MTNSLAAPPTTFMPAMSRSVPLTTDSSIESEFTPFMAACPLSTVLSLRYRLLSIDVLAPESKTPFYNYEAVIG